MLTLHPRDYKALLVSAQNGNEYTRSYFSDEQLATEWCPIEGCDGWQWDDAHPWCYRHCIERLGETEVKRLAKAYRDTHPEAAESWRQSFGPWTREEVDEFDRNTRMFFGPKAELRKVREREDGLWEPLEGVRE